MSKKLTPWFKGDAKPKHIGVYEVDDKDGISGNWFAYWDGAKFCYRSTTPEDAYRERCFSTDCKPLVKWRGLAEKP